MRIDKEAYQCTLSLDHAADKSLFTDPMAQDFGSEPDIEYEQIRIRVGKRPIVKNLADYYETSGREIPEEYKFYVSYDVWMVTMFVGLMKEGGWKRISQFGCQLEYDENPKITILELLPQTEFIDRASGELKCNTLLSLDGKASLPDEFVNPIGSPEVVSAGAVIHSSNEVNIAVNLAFSVLTPTIVATGVGDHIAEWIFKKNQQPLLGDQILAQVILVPVGVTQLNLKTRVYATVAGFASFPVRLKGDWVPISFDLTT